MPSNRHGFYTYEAKYLDEEGATIRVPADLTPGVSDKVRKLSIEAFRMLGCEGLARVDFFLGGSDKLIEKRNAAAIRNRRGSFITVLSFTT